MKTSKAFAVYRYLKQHLLIALLSGAIGAVCCQPVWASDTQSQTIKWTDIWAAHPLYMGVGLGYGSTDWSYLVGQDSTTLQTTPASAQDNLFTWNLFIGYEIKSYFGVEANYQGFTDTAVYFDPYWASQIESHYHIDFSELDPMYSRTYVFNGVAKFLVPIGQTGLRGFADAGLGYIHRHDVIAITSRVTPTFGIGINYVFSKRYMSELAFQYYAGYDAASTTPSKDYIPFIYTLLFRVAYRF